MIDVKLKFNIKNRENCEKELKKKKRVTFVEGIHPHIPSESQNSCHH